MIELIVNKKTKIRVPSKFKELRLSAGVEVIKYYGEKEDNLTLDDKIIIISTLCNLEPDIFMGMTAQTIEDVFKHLEFFKKEEQTFMFFKSFKLNGTVYGLLDYDKLTVHEYADIDFYLSEGEHPLENLDKIMTVLFRPIVNKKQSVIFILKNILSSVFFKGIIPKEYRSYEIKEYSENDANTAQIFGRDMDMGFAIAAYQNMLAERIKISDDFPTIFKSEISEGDKDQYDEETPGTPKNKGKSLGEIWGLFHYVSELSNSLDERERWYKKHIREFFTYLSYHNQKTEEENQRIRSQNIQS